jgi:ParB-like chromosome segregation protein Spo0J
MTRKRITTGSEASKPPHRYASKITLMPLDALKRYSRNSRTHSRRQIKQIAASLQQFGWTNPILIDENNRVLCEHGRLDAAQLVGLIQVRRYGSII